jgi:DNA-binding CsgD family transcriptional regulator
MSAERKLFGDHRVESEAEDLTLNINARRALVAKLRREYKWGNTKIAESIGVPRTLVTHDLAALRKHDPTMRLRAPRRSKEDLLVDDERVKQGWVQGLTGEENAMQNDLSLHAVRRHEQRLFRREEIRRKLKIPTTEELLTRGIRVKELLLQGYTHKKIGDELDLSGPQIRRSIQRLRRSGLL